MQAHMPSVTAELGEKAAVAEEAPSFEEFYEATFRRLFTALCLVTGNRHEAEEMPRTPSSACSSDGTA